MMNNIGTLYTYELKKIANRKLVWIVGMIMIALSMFLSVSDLVTSSSYYGETSVSAYQAMKFNKDNAEKLSGMAIDDTLLREMQEDCANESKDHTKSQAVTSNNQIAIDIGVGSDDTESSVLKKYFPIYSYVQQITDDDERKVTMQELHAAIASLPNKQAKRIYAHFILGMTKQDIARAEGVHEKVVRVAIERGLRHLEKILKNSL